MRSLRLLAVLVAVMPIAACASAKPGWTYAPAPSATPIASVAPSAPASGDPSAPASTAPSPGASGSAAPSASSGGTSLELIAEAIAFDKAELAAPADQPLQIHFTNNDAAIQHNVAIHEGSATGPEVFKGEIFPGVDERTYEVAGLPAGTYGFVCTVHPNMVGTLTAG